MPFLLNDRLMDPFTIKPIDAEGIIANAKECGGRILVVEDHYPEVSCHIYFFYVKGHLISEWLMNPRI